MLRLTKTDTLVKFKRQGEPRGHRTTFESSKFSGSKSKSKRYKDQILILISIDQTLDSGR